MEYSIDQSESVESVVSNMYRLIAKQPLDIDLLQIFLDKSNGVFMLQLPMPVAIDKDYYEQLHKQALAALIAA